MIGFNPVKDEKKKNYKSLTFSMTFVIVLFGLLTFFLVETKQVYECDLDHVNSMRCAKLSSTNVTCYPSYSDYSDGKQCRTGDGWYLEVGKNG